jgi:Holliday junction DNA helicase RuvA
MYGYFKGIIENVFDEKIILDVNDIGYEIYMPESEIINIKEKKDKIKIYTYLNVREDEMKLFGFTSQNNLDFFKKLISVSGVGPKMAIGIISNISPNDMCIAIATENILALKSIPGIGPKMAQKIIFELKDKVQKEDLEKATKGTGKIVVNNKNIDEAVTALEVLGYSKKEIKEVIQKVNISDEKVEDIIRIVLKEMQK